MILIASRLDECNQNCLELLCMQIYTTEQLKTFALFNPDGVHAIGRKHSFVRVAASKPIVSAVRYAVILAM